MRGNSLTASLFVAALLALGCGDPESEASMSVGEPVWRVPWSASTPRFQVYDAVSRTVLEGGSG